LRSWLIYSEKGHKLQASSFKLDITVGFDRIILMTSFGAFPVDKFAKAPQQRDII